MALRRYHNDPHIAFPTPGRATDIFYPNTYREYRAYPYDPYDPYERRLSRRRDRKEREPEHDGPVEKKINELREDLDGYSGDLGWSLEFATAWCYRHLLGNRTEVVDMIDNARQLVDEITIRVPEMLFDGLDKALFGGKLEKMVRLRWKLFASSTPGVTAAPGIHGRRICIQLNKAPFENGDGDIDDLLDAMIHQMIHAFFLVCCGAQPKGANQDGRLSDGLHFGVLLYTIMDISRRCLKGPLLLIFYSKDRRTAERERQLVFAPNNRARRDPRLAFVTLDTRGTAMGLPPADGESHCTHENGSTTRPQIKNWQVQNYSVAIDLAMDEKGDDIYDLKPNRELLPSKRCCGPASATYVELVWSGKRIMIPKEKAMKFPSLKKAIEKDSKKELKVPDCSPELLNFLWDFIARGDYHDPDPLPLEDRKTVDYASLQGPPVIDAHDSYTRAEEAEGREQEGQSMLTHIRIFKLGEALKFEELQQYALLRLYTMRVTHENPLPALTELYNEAGDDKSKPIHSELHKWAREFLIRSASRTDRHHHHQQYNPSHHYYNNNTGTGDSNLCTLLRHYKDAFTTLAKKSEAFKDDCNHVQNELFARHHSPNIPNFYSDHQQHQTWDPYAWAAAAPHYYHLPAPPLTSSLLDDSSMLHRRRSWDALGLRDDVARLLMSVETLDPRYWVPYIGRDGRRKARNVLTMEKVYI